VTSTYDEALEARYVIHYVGSNASATYTGTQAVWALSEAEAERKARALLEPYCVNALTGDLRLAITAIVRGYG
jgi:hypothetical protein